MWFIEVVIKTSYYRPILRVYSAKHETLTYCSFDVGSTLQTDD